MPTYNISTGFNGIDRVTPAFVRIGKSAASARNKMNGAFNSVSKTGLKMRHVIGGNLIAGGIQKGMSLISQGIGKVTDEFILFDDAITGASAKFKNLTPETLILLKKEARAVGAQTKFSASEAAQGLDFLAMAGFNAQQSMKVLAPTAKLATVGNIDLARSTDIASDSLGAFGLMTTDSVKLQKNFIAMNDSMAATMTRSNTGIEDMFEAIKKGAPAFTAAGQSMNSFNSLVGIMANSGLKGSESGTQLRNMMLRLADPTKEAQKVISSLGVKVQDSKGNFRDVIDILSDFEKGTKNLGTAQRSAALSTVFGARSVTGINILLKEGTKNIRSFRNELDNSAGAADRMAGIMNKSLGARIKSIQSALIEVGFKFFEAFEEKGKNSLDRLVNSIRKFDPTKIINGLKFVIKIVSDLMPLIKILVPLYIGWTAAQWALNVAMSANPINLLIIGIIALIAAGVLLVKNWDTVKVGFIKMWDGIKNAFSVSIDFMKRGLFTFADVILTTYGNVFKLILKGAERVGKFIGLDVSGLSGLISNFEKLQSNVREQSFINGEIKAPNAAKEEGKRMLSGEGTITVKATTGTEIVDSSNSINGVNIAQAGAY